MTTVSLTVNGKAVTATIDPRTLLVQLLRENLRLTGTHVGCDTSQCGACVVHLDGKAVKSCTINPARAIGVDDVTGSIAVGKRADFTVLSSDLKELECVYIKGKRI